MLEGFCRVLLAVAPGDFWSRVMCKDDDLRSLGAKRVATNLSVESRRHFQAFFLPCARSVRKVHIGPQITHGQGTGEETLWALNPINHGSINYEESSWLALVVVLAQIIVFVSFQLRE